MPALYLVIPALCVGAIAYRYYSAFIAAKVMVLDDTRQTPAHSKYDGANFYPTQRWGLFGHHFASITGAGPLLGPVLAVFAAKRVAERRGVGLNAAAFATVLLSGLLTAGVVYAALS